MALPNINLSRKTEEAKEEICCKVLPFNYEHDAKLFNEKHSPTLSANKFVYAVKQLTFIGE